MNLEAMRSFLSEESIKKHIEHLRTLRLRLSILEKSLPELLGKDIRELTRIGFNREICDEAVGLKWSMLAHECFFDSFALNPAKSGLLANQCLSRESFIYNVYLEAMKNEHCFAFVYIEKGTVKTDFAHSVGRAFIKYTPILALDLYEHAYFSDYGFDKGRYLRSALALLDTGRLN